MTKKGDNGEGYNAFADERLMTVTLDSYFLSKCKYYCDCTKMHS